MGLPNNLPVRTHLGGRTGGGWGTPGSETVEGPQFTTILVLFCLFIIFPDFSMKWRAKRVEILYVDYMNLYFF